MITMPLLFPNHPLVRADGTDYVIREFERLHRPAKLDYSSKTGLRWHANGLSLGRMRIFTGEVNGAVTITTEPVGNMVHLLMPRFGGGWIRHENRERRLALGAGALVTPSGSQTLHMEGGYETLTIAIEETFIAESLSALSGINSAKRVEFDLNFDTKQPYDAELMRLIDFILVTLTRDPSPLAHPLILNNLQNAFVSALVLLHPHNHRSLLEANVPTASARAVERVEAYLDAHANRPITTAELHDIAGMSLRSIQLGFKAKRGCSPMAFLRERRLLMAKERFDTAQPNTQVTEVALSCGFSHLGRFSRDYAKRFGEKPSETLHRTLETRYGLKRTT